MNTHYNVRYSTGFGTGKEFGSVVVEESSIEKAINFFMRTFYPHDLPMNMRVLAIEEIAKE